MLSKVRPSLPMSAPTRPRPGGPGPGRRQNQPRKHGDLSQSHSRAPGRAARLMQQCSAEAGLQAASASESTDGWGVDMPAGASAFPSRRSAFPSRRAAFPSRKACGFPSRRRNPRCKVCQSGGGSSSRIHGRCRAVLKGPWELKHLRPAPSTAARGHDARTHQGVRGGRA